jgi:hypothetical protein
MPEFVREMPPLFGLSGFVIGRRVPVGPFGGFDPGCNPARWNGLPGRMRDDSTGGDDQPFVEFHARELLGFGFGRKRAGCPWASPFDQGASSRHFKGYVPDVVHPPPSGRRFERLLTGLWNVLQPLALRNDLPCNGALLTEEALIQIKAAIAHFTARLIPENVWVDSPDGHGKSVI